MKKFGTRGYGRRLAPGKDGSVAVTTSDYPLRDCAGLSSFDRDGEQQWSVPIDKNTSVNRCPFIAAVARDAQDDLFVVSDMVARLFASDRDILLGKIDAAGAAVWTQYYNGEGSSDDLGEDVTVDAEGNIIAIGRLSRPDLDWIPWLAKYDPSGALLWMQTEEKATFGGRTRVKAGPNNDIWLARRSFDHDGHTEPLVIERRAPNGDVLWQTLVEQPDLFLESFELTPEGVALAFVVEPHSYASSLYKLSPDGEVVEVFHLPQDEVYEDEAGAIIHVENASGAPTPDGFLYVILGGYVDQAFEPDSKRAALLFRKFSPDFKELRTNYYAMPSGEGFSHGQLAVYDAAIAGDQLVFLAEQYIGAVLLPSP